jgi:radical SAM protein (TIGR01212 family)
MDGPSTATPLDWRGQAPWRAAGLRYYPLGWFLRARFGGRVWKASLDAGLDCPNRDGTLGRGGCIYCDPMSFSPARRAGSGTVPFSPGLRSASEQLAAAIARLPHGDLPPRVLAYFQPGSNTYAPPERLRAVFEAAIGHPQVVGLIIGTRPDCLPDETLALLAELSERTWLLVELGLQSIHDATLQRINRGHGSAAFFDAVARCAQRRLNVGVHVILGLPGESAAMMFATAAALAALPIHSVKLHNLYAVRNTPLAEMLARGEVRLPVFDEYVDWAVGFLERLSPDCVVDRLSGDAPAEYLIGPEWCRERSRVRRAIEQELTRRDTWQGRLCGM